MKHLLLITALTVLVSCGKDTTTTVENAYDDSQNKATLLLQDARIAALEARQNAFSTNFDEVVIDFGERFNNLEDASTSLNEALDYNVSVVTAALADLNTKQINIMPICGSGENLIKTSSGVYAVYMVSNNYGTYLGKLAENVNYSTTDVSRKNFKIVASEIVCL